MVIRLERNIPRSFIKLDHNLGRLLIIYFPSGFEEFFKDLGSINLRKFSNVVASGPILIQLLEKTYGARMIIEES